MIASSLVAVQPSCAISKRRADLLAHDYYFGKPEDQKLAKDIAAELAITPERILGQAMSGEYRLFDRLVDSRVTMLNGLLKDHERQLRKAEKRKAAARQRDPTRVNDNSVAEKNKSRRSIPWPPKSRLPPTAKTPSAAPGPKPRLGDGGRAATRSDTACHAR